METDGDITAKCLKVDGTWVKATKSLNDFIGNDNGKLIWKPHGGFAKSSRKLVLKGSDLEYQAKNINENWSGTKTFSLNKLINRNGEIIAKGISPNVPSTVCKKFGISNDLKNFGAICYTEIYYTNLNEKISSVDGVLTYKDGKFAKNCKSCTVFALAILTCTCKNSAGKDITSSIDLDKYLIPKRGEFYFVS